MPDFNQAVKQGLLILVNTPGNDCRSSPEIKLQPTLNSRHERRQLKSVLQTSREENRVKQLVPFDPNYHAFILGFKVKQEQETAAPQGQRA